MTTELLPHIERILDAARSAPSRDNLQPWRFIVRGESVSFLVDPSRDASPLNAGQRMARIAVGAAIENALLRAGRMGMVVQAREPEAGALMTMTFTAPKRFPDPDKALVRRATNRRAYDARVVDDATFAHLREATQPLAGAQTHWFGRERVKTLAPIVGEAEAIAYAEDEVRASATAAMRFDARDRDETPRGLPLGSLELSQADRVTFDALRRTPYDRLAALGAFKKVGAREQKLVESASGVFIVVAAGDDPLADVGAGRAMQRAWLTLTRREMVAQPLATLPGLEAMLDTGAPLRGEQEARAVVASFRAAFPSVDRTSRIAVVARFGVAPAPTARAGRLAATESTEIAPPLEDANSPGTVVFYTLPPPSK
jgi:hypothetical protein